MKSLDEIRVVKEKQEEEWLQYSGITGIDIGNKFVGRNRTDGLSIRVLVEKKMKEEKVKEGEIIPPTVDGGILFGLGKFQGDLNNRPPDDSNERLVSKELRCEFEKNGVSLSQKASIKERNSKWQINDDILKQVYTIKKGLSIYRRNEELLFGIGLEFQGDLSEYPVSPKLRREFEKNGILLSDKATVSTEEPDSRWQIVDGNQVFTIKRELSIYEAVKTDVIEREFLIFPEETDVDKDDETSEWDRDLKLKGGIGIGGKGDSPAAGTMGAIVKARDFEPKGGDSNGLMFLTCCHVFDWSAGKHIKIDQQVNQVSADESHRKVCQKRRCSKKRIAIEGIQIDSEETYSHPDGSHRKTVNRKGVARYRRLSQSGVAVGDANIKGVVRYRELPQPGDVSQFEGESETGVDCAVIELKDSDKFVSEYTSEIVDIGRIRGAGKARRGMEVRKYGQKTELTYGVVDSVNLTVKIDKPLPFSIEFRFRAILNNLAQSGLSDVQRRGFEANLRGRFKYNEIELSKQIKVLVKDENSKWLIVDKGNHVTYAVKKNDENELNVYRQSIFTNQIGIVVDFARSSKFGDRGDSGAVVVNNTLEAVGLLFASNKGGTYCAATPIQAVLGVLNVEIYEEELKGLDRDIDDSMRAIVMPPPPLRGRGRQFLYGQEICGRCDPC